MADFKIGDVVVCVNDSPCWCCGLELPIRVGKLYKVAALQGPTLHSISGAWVVSLVLSGVPLVRGGQHRGFGQNSERFQHLPKADPAFTEQMRAIKPRKQVTA